MKRILVVLTLASGLLCTSAFAGSQIVMHTTPPAACGTGWYFGLQGGGNISQNISDRHVDINGVDVALGMDSNVGGYGGIKFGYVFGTSDWRLALEEDWYYNGLDADAHVRING